MGNIPKEVILLAIFAAIIIFAIVKGSSISLTVKNWFSVDSKKPSTIDVGKKLDISEGELGEAVGAEGAGAGHDVGSVKVLEEANARGAKIGRLVGIQDPGTPTKPVEKP
jgi:hypothetical protein